MDQVWMKPPPGEDGEPQLVDATVEVISPLTVRGWRQCDAPGNALVEPVAQGGAASADQSDETEG